MREDLMLEIITADALATRHGFFTRKGGASLGAFSGLNCDTGSSDVAEAVATNRARVADAMGVDDSGLITVDEVHSANVITVTDPAAAPGMPRPRADGLVTRLPGVALAVLSADCQPVLFHDSHARVIGAAHAGWQGTLNGVLEATLAAMERLGANRADTVAVIGPTISQAAYEVGPEFVERFLNEDHNYASFFANGAGDRALFDLPAFGLYRLRQAGVGQALWTGHCTYNDPDRFYSYRRATHVGEANYGCMISAIRL